MPYRARIAALLAEHTTPRGNRIAVIDRGPSWSRRSTISLSSASKSTSKACFTNSIPIDRNGARDAALSRATNLTGETAMTRKTAATTLPQPERHSRTQAAKTTADLENTTAHPRTTRQILTEQQNPAKPDLTQKPGPTPGSVEKLPVLAGASTVSINQNKLDQWATLPQISINFNGNDGTFDALDGSTVTDREFIALIPRATKGYTRFHGKGVQPDVAESCLGDGTPDITRDELGEHDPEQWEYGLDGQRRDPWQPHMTLPLIARDDSGDLYQFVARNKVSIIAVQQLLGRYKHHPRGKAGALPVIKLGSVDYYNKKFKVDKPKPVLGIVDWVTRDGAPADPKSLPKAPHEFNDSIPY